MESDWNGPVDNIRLALLFLGGELWLAVSFRASVLLLPDQTINPSNLVFLIQRYSYTYDHLLL
jgi:hypothetical protein